MCAEIGIVESSRKASEQHTDDAIEEELLRMVSVHGDVLDQATAISSAQHQQPPPRDGDDLSINSELEHLKHFEDSVRSELNGVEWWCDASEGDDEEELLPAAVTEASSDDAVEELVTRAAKQTTGQKKIDPRKQPHIATREPSKKRSRGLVWVVCFLLLLAFAARLCAAIQNILDNQAFWDTACAPIKPGTAAAPHGIYEAPWWAPAFAKPFMFQHICGSNRKRTRLECKADGKRSRIKVIDLESGKEVYHRRYIIGAIVHEDHVSVLSRKKKSPEAKQGPWASR